MDFTNLGNPNVVVVASTNPVLKKGDTTVFGDKTAALGAELCITTDCRNVELAMRWCDWWYTEDGYYTTNYGIEGESFVFDDQGNPQYLRQRNAAGRSRPQTGVSVVYAG